MVADRIESSPAFREFAAQLRAGQIAHAYLLLGPDAVAREAFAAACARAILCPRGGCGQCPTCTKLLHRAHPDVEILNEDGKMKVKDVEEWSERAALRALEANSKLYFVQHAQLLSPAVQNKMLKLYEDPPDGVIIFLLGASETGLLPTILSRAVKRFVPPFSTREVQDELTEQGVEERVAATAAVLSGGRFDLAFRFAQDEGVDACYEEAFRVLSECKRTSDAIRFTRGKGFQKERIGITLEFMEIILNDVLTLVTGAARPYRTLNRDYQIGVIARGFSAAGVAMALGACNTARQKLAVNVGSEAVAEGLIFDILEAKYKWRS